MGDGIGFEKTGAGLIPLVGLEGDVLSEKGPGFGGSPPSLLVLGSDRGSEPIESSWGNSLESLGDLWRDRAKELTISGEPQKQDGFEPFGTGKFSGQPDPLEESKEDVGIIANRSASFLGFRFRESSKSAK